MENASRLVDIPRITRPEPRQEPRPESNDLLDNLEVIEEAHAGDKSLRKKRSKKKAQLGAGGAIALAMGRGISSLGEFFNHPLRHSFLLLVLFYRSYAMVGTRSGT